LRIESREYWAAVAMHGSASVTILPNEIFFSWAMMLLFSVIYFYSSGFLFRIVLRKDKVDATLSMQ
jgi:hypothetical protein